MGYHVSATGGFTITEDQIVPAFQAMCRLNDLDDLKLGGHYPRTERPEGLDHHPGRWFAGLGADYPSTSEDLWYLLDELGFYISGHPGCPVTTDSRKPAGPYDVTVQYDGRMRQEELFLEVLFRFVDTARIEYVGDEHEHWSIEAQHGEVTHYWGVIEWVKRSHSSEIPSDFFG
jgi:hypothetical protein